MKVTTMSQVFTPERRRTHLTVERVNGEALQRIMDKRGITATQLSKKAGVTYYSIHDFLKGTRLLGDSKTVNKLAEALDIDPVEIVLCPGEHSTIYKGILPEEKIVPGATDKPLPLYIEGAKYRIINKGRGGSITDGIFKFVGTAKGPKVGDRQLLHYMFMNTAGKWTMTLTDIDLRSDGVEITPTNEKAAKVA